MTIFQSIVRRRLKGCWLWPGARNHGGYGVMRYRGKTRRVHRVSAHLFLGFDLDGSVKVLHRCDNPSCFNPSHLFDGTQKDNIADARAKGRLWNQSMTHCIHGHRLSGANLYIRKRGSRCCRACNRDRQARYIKLKEAA